MELEKFEPVQHRNYSVDIGGCISEGFDLFKKEPGAFIGFLFITLIFSMLASLIPFVGSLVSSVISTFMYLGLYKTIRKMRHNQEFSFNNFFDGFKLDAGQVIGLALVSAIFIVLGFLCLIIPGIYLAVAYAFAVPLFSVVEKDFWGCMEMSRKIISKNWFSIFGLLIVLFLLNVLGFICLIIGLLVTIPVTYCAIYIAFENICQVDTLDDFDQKLENLGKPDLDY